MDIQLLFWWLLSVSCWMTTKKCSVLGCVTIDAKHKSYEEVTVAENTPAVFIHTITPAASEAFGDSSFNVEIKLCEKETYYMVCWCRWLSDSNGVCRNQTISSVCEANKSEMRFTLLIKRTYSNIMWELFRQNSTPLVLKHSKLHVTYPATITALRLNGRDINGTEYVAENQEVSISCFFTNGNPAVSIRLVDDKGSTLSSTRHKEGPLVLSRDFHCNDVRLTIGCEAPGSKLNRSVTILVKCLPELSPISNQVLDLSRIVGQQLQFRMKSYTSNIRKCLMTKLPPQPITKEVTCNLSGSVPEFNLTLSLLTESWIGQGIWMLHVTTEIGNSNISFGLIDSSVNGRRPELMDVDFAWIVINDMLTDGKWVLTSARRPVVYTNWGAGEPNNYLGEREDCGGIYNTGLWSDDSCETTKPLPYVCESPV